MQVCYFARVLSKCYVRTNCGYGFIGLLNSELCFCMNSYSFVFLCVVFLHVYIEYFSIEFGEILVSNTKW